MTVATLMVGLPDTSRLKLHYGSSRVSLDRLLLASILDGVHILAWLQSKDGAHGRRRPESVLKSMVYGNNAGKEQVQTFDTSEDFEAERARLLRKVRG